MTTNVKNTQMQDMLDARYVPRRDMLHQYGNALSTLMFLPSLRGVWGMGSRDENGNVYDVSGQGRTLTNVSSMTFGIRNKLIPYGIHDASADLLRRTSEAALQIAGRITLGGWFYATTAALGSAQGLIGKWLSAGNQQSYLLNLTAGGAVRAHVSSTGANDTTVDNAVVSDATWFHAVLKYIPSTSLSVFLNGVEVENTTSIPASIFASTANFEIGAYSTGSFVLGGRSTLCFLCATALDGAAIQSVYYSQRAMFGH